jgi:tRNA-uridine 2-sulfurtransferase
MSKPTVIVGMSGGVDSSVSALLLKNQGYHVIGLFMKNWEEDGICPAAVDYEDVSEVCKKIGISYYTVNFAKEYRELVFSDFLKESLAGRTPNPDILCNREIKFKVFFEKAKELGADFLATGHYCQLKNEMGRTQLVKGFDPNKDQTYFLCAVKESVLKSVLFPIGHLPKTEVRKIALENGLCTASKKDSTGICFVGKRDFKEFLSQHLQATPGDFEMLDGKKVGRHDGLPYYTIGQRKGLMIGGPGDAWFVVGKDIERNIVYIEQGENHPALFTSRLKANQASWVADEPPSNWPYRCQAKVRYRQSDRPCTIVAEERGTLEVHFDEPQRAVTPGQSVVFYQGDVCLGGAIISHSWNS